MTLNSRILTFGLAAFITALPLVSANAETVELRCTCVETVEQPCTWTRPFDKERGLPEIKADDLFVKIKTEASTVVWGGASWAPRTYQTAHATITDYQVSWTSVNKDKYLLDRRDGTLWQTFTLGNHSSQYGCKKAKRVF